MFLTLDPLAENGEVFIGVEDDHAWLPFRQQIRIPISRVQLEQDTAKSIKDHVLATPGTEEYSKEVQFALSRMFLDHNRAGMALIEIITPPVIYTARVAALTFSKITNILREANVSTAMLHLGAVRCDVNVSLGVGGPRTEIKNLNSVRAIRESIHYEIGLQKELYLNGVPLQSRTKTWDGTATRTLRIKGGDQEYRFGFDK